MTQGLGNGFRVITHVSGEGHDGVAGPLADALNTGGGIALEYGAILGKSDLSRGVLCRLPIRIVGAAVDIVDLLAIELEGNPQLDQRLYLALPGDDAVTRGGNRKQVAGADGGEHGSSRPLYVDYAPSGEVALEGA